MSTYSRRHCLRSLPDCTARVRRDSLRPTLAAGNPIKNCGLAGAEQKRRGALVAYRVPAVRDGEHSRRPHVLCGRRRAQKEKVGCAAFGWCSYR